jgi:hypothetical protein
MTITDSTESLADIADLADCEPVHEYREVPDVKYAHLVNAQCSCGWRLSGYVKRGLAERLWQEHAPAPF